MPMGVFLHSHSKNPPEKHSWTCRNTSQETHRLCPSSALDPSPQLLWQNKVLVSDASVPGAEPRAQRQLSVLSSSLVTVFWFPSTELMTDSFDLNVEIRSRGCSKRAGGTLTG